MNQTRLQAAVTAAAAVEEAEETEHQQQHPGRLWHHNDDAVGLEGRGVEGEAGARSKAWEIEVSGSQVAAVHSQEAPVNELEHVTHRHASGAVSVVHQLEGR
jgi:hypothetical protein